MTLLKNWNLSSILLVILVAGCEKGNSWEKVERQQISDYIKTIPDSLYTLEPSGLYYFEILKGTGLSPVDNDTAFFKYRGTFLNGIAFDSVSTVKAPYAYVMGSGAIITGIDEGLKYMKAGGKSKLLTPSSLAYGAKGIWGVIPSYTPLLWEIELVTVKQGPHK